MRKVWPKVRLGELLRQYQEYVGDPDPRLYPKLSVKLYGKGVVLDTPTDGATVRMKRHQLAKAGQVILSEIWGKKGAIGFVPQDGVGALCTSHFFLFDVCTDRLLPGWLQAIFSANYLQEQLDAQAKGTTGYAAVRPATLLACEIPLPPLAEQRRLVARIEVLAAKIDAARELRLHVADEAEALGHAGSEATYRRLAGRFGVQPLEAVCHTITDGDHNTPAFTDAGVPFIFVGNVSTGRLHFHKSTRVSEQYFNSLRPQRIPKQGDILYTAVGATLGVPAVVDTGEPFCFQRHIAILKPDSSRLDSRFAWHMLRSGTVFEKAWGSTTGSAQPTVPLRAIRVLPIPVPPLDEQLRMVLELDRLQAKVGELEVLQTETAGELEALFPALLDGAFSGQL